MNTFKNSQNKSSKYAWLEGFEFKRENRSTVNTFSNYIILSKKSETEAEYQGTEYKDIYIKILTSTLAFISPSSIVSWNKRNWNEKLVLIVCKLLDEGAQRFQCSICLPELNENVCSESWSSLFAWTCRYFQFIFSNSCDILKYS